MLLMGFSQKGIDVLKRFQADLEMRFPDEETSISEGLEDGLWIFSYRCHHTLIEINDSIDMV